MLSSTLGYLPRRWPSCQSLEERYLLTTVTLELNEILRRDASHHLDSGSLADMDGDGDLDWLTALAPAGSSPQDELSNLALFVNDGKGSFEFSHLINPESNAERPIGAFSVGDMDGDGDQDIVSLSWGALFWDENLENGAFERHEVVGVDDTIVCDAFFTWSQGEFIQTFDYDGDGDFDIIVNREACNSGFENLGNGAFVARAELAIDTGGDTTAFDLEDDGDVDFISVDRSTGETRLLVNDGVGGLKMQKLAQTRLGGAADWRLFDHDGDGIRELVSSSVWIDEFKKSGIELPFRFPEYSLIAVANIDGDLHADHFVVEQLPPISTEFNIHWTADTTHGPVLHLNPWFVSQADREYSRLAGHDFFQGIEVVDLDLDGDDDLFLHGSVSVRVIINHLTGDANGDNTVDFADFLSLSSNFGKAADAVWEDGDFNLDGTVDFTDFLSLNAAFGESRG